MIVLGMLRLRKCSVLRRLCFVAGEWVEAVGFVIGWGKAVGAMVPGKPVEPNVIEVPLSVLVVSAGVGVLLV